MSDDGNLKLWRAVESTDKKFTKYVNMRGGFTTINATYQAKKATEQWGPYGEGWGIDDPQLTFHGDSVILHAFFWYSESEEGAKIRFPYMVDDKWKDGDDTCKKLMTEMQSKCLSKLGFSGDIFSGEWDDNKYVQQDRTPKDIAGKVEEMFGDDSKPSQPRPQPKQQGGGSKFTDPTGLGKNHSDNVSFTLKGAGADNGWEFGTRMNVLRDNFEAVKSMPKGAKGSEFWKNLGDALEPADMRRACKWFENNAPGGKVSLPPDDGGDIPF